MFSISQLRESRQEKDWQDALEHYWQMASVQRNLKIEKFMDWVTPQVVAKYDSNQWYNFLRLYFEWKFTDPRWFDQRLNDLAANGTEKLFAVKESLMALEEFDLADVRKCLRIVKSPEIFGLGYPGASGLLAVLFKSWYGTVDKFVVESLSDIESLPEKERIGEIDAWLRRPREWRESDAVLLVDIMRRKAKALNALFGADNWTPRKIDMVLWASRDDGTRCA